MTQDERMKDALSQQVNPEGHGEDPAIRQIITQGDTMGDAQAGSLLYQIQVMLTGFNEKNEERFKFIEAEMKKRDRAEAAFRANQELFLENLQERSKNLLITNPDDKARFEATQGKRQQEAITKAMTRHKDVRKRLAEEEQETVMWEGELKMTREGESIKPVMVPVRINIENIIYEFKPGEVVQVPASVAARLRQRKRDMEKNEKVKNIFSPDSSGLFKEDKTINQELLKLDAGAELLPTG